MIERGVAALKLAGEMLEMGVVMGWSQCFPYCAGTLTPYVMGTRTTWQEGLRAAAVFSGGRLAVYVAFGILAGSAPALMPTILRPGLGTFSLQAAAGLLLLFLSITVLFNKHTETGVCRWIIRRDLPAMFLLGMLIAVPPYHDLVAPTSLLVQATSPISGLLGGLAYGIGTTISPLILIAMAAPLLTGRFKTTGWFWWAQRAGGAALLILAVRAFWALKIPAL